jgi:hypothetical protein
MAAEQQQQPEPIAEETTDQSPPDGGAEQAPDCAAPLDPLYEQRHKRILQFRAESMLRSNSALACVGAVCSDLLDIQQPVGEAARQQVRSSLDGIEYAAPVIDLNLRLAKQIAQLTQIELHAQARDDAVARVRQNEQANNPQFCAPNRPR